MVWFEYRAHIHVSVKKHNGAATRTVRMHKTCSEMIGFIWGSTEKVYSVYVAKVVWSQPTVLSLSIFSLLGRLFSMSPSKQKNVTRAWIFNLTTRPRLWMCNLINITNQGTGIESEWKGFHSCKELHNHI